MREFFRGWKRKLGVSTLVLACALTSLWIRITSTHTPIEFQIGGMGVRAFEFNGKVALLRYWPVGQEFSLLIRCENDDVSFELSVDGQSPQVVRKLAFSGAQIEFARHPDSVVGCDVVLAPLPMFIVPMTLLSAWLLLAKQPRVNPVKPPVDQP